MSLVRVGLASLVVLGLIASNSVSGQQPSSSMRKTTARSTGDNRGSAQSVPKAGNTGTVQKTNGVLGRIFGGGGGSSSGRSAGPGDTGDDDGRRVIQTIPRSEPPDWTGVPFHQGTPAAVGRNSTPLSDPTGPSSRVASLPRAKSSGATSASRSSNASAAPARTNAMTNNRPSASETSSNVPKPPAEGANVPRPVSSTSSKLSAVSTASAPGGAEVRLETSTYQPLSATESSRRARRKSVDPLEIDLEQKTGNEASPSDLTAEAGTTATPSTPSRSRRSDGVSQPRVSRRSLPETANEQTPSAPNASVPSTGSRETAAATVPSVPPSLQAPTSTEPARVPTGQTPAPTTAAPRSFDVELTPAKSQAATVPSTGDAPAAPETSATPPAPSAPQAITGPQAMTAPEVPSLPATPSTSAATNDLAATSDLSVKPSITAGESTNPSTSVSTTPVNMTSEIPGLRVITSGPADIPIRKGATYQIIVENRGAMDAPGAAIQIKLPTWVDVQNVIPSRGEIVRQNDANERQLLWVVEGLPKNGREQLSLQVIATQAREFSVNVEWAVVPQTSTAKITVREPKLQVVIEGPDQVVFGESETYRVRVLNPGNGVADNVIFTLSPNSATPQSQQIGRILPGDEAKFEVELMARDLESLQIHGLATGDLDLKEEQVKTIGVVAANLRAVLTGPSLKYQDTIGNFKLELANEGVADCTNVEAVLELPAGIVYQAGIDGAVSKGNTLRWTIGAIESGKTVEYQVDCKMERTGVHTIAFKCQGTAAGAAKVQFQTQVDALADLVLTINDPQAPAPIGKEVVYEIVIHNRGSKAATDVVALAQFGFDIEPIRIEGGQGTLEPGQVLFEPIAKLDAGQTVTLKVIARADKPGHHRFRSEVRCGDTLLIAEEATRYLEMVGERISRSSNDSENR